MKDAVLKRRSKNPKKRTVKTVAFVVREREEPAAYNQTHGCGRTHKDRHLKPSAKGEMFK